MTWKRKQANWQIVTAALVTNEEHMSDYNTTLKMCVQQDSGEEPIQRYLRKELAKRLERAGCTLAEFRSETRFTGRI